MSRWFCNLDVIFCESWYAWSICISECSISWNILPIYQTFRPFMPHADSAPGTCIPQREEVLSLRYAGQSRLGRDLEEARGTGHRSPVHPTESQETR